MMNWRMIGILFSHMNAPLLGWSVACAGMILTVFLAIKLWRSFSIIFSRTDLASSQIFWLWSVLGTLAATCAITWHSHIHMGLILIPAIALLYSTGDLKDSLLNIWLFFPYGIFFLNLIFGWLHNNPAIMAPGQIGGFLLGLCGLLINMLLLIVSYKQIRTMSNKIPA